MNYPYDLNAESAILGCIILDPGYAVPKVKGHLLAAHFYDTKHGLIYKTLMSMDGIIPIDIVSLKDRLLELKLLDSVGGLDDLVYILESVPPAGNIERYAFIVKKKFVERESINKAHEIIKDPARASIHAQEITKLKILINPPSNPNDLLECAIADIERSRDGYEISTGLTELDYIIMGLRRGAVYVFAGDTSHGKTAFSLFMARYNLKGKKIRVGYFTYDMADKYIALRLAGQFSGINVRKFCMPNGATYLDDTGTTHTACYSSSELEEVKGKMRDMLKEHGERVIIKGHTTISQIEGELACGNCDLLFIDYIQTAVSTDNAYRPFAQAIGDYIKELKRLANKYNVCIVVLSQFHRTNAEQLKKRQRQLSDLKESSSIEQGADVIVFVEWVYREEIANGKEPQEARNSYNDYRVRVLKNNMGACGWCKLHFDPLLQTFREEDPCDKELIDVKE